MSRRLPLIFVAGSRVVGVVVAVVAIAASGVGGSAGRVRGERHRGVAGDRRPPAQGARRRSRQRRAGRAAVRDDRHGPPRARSAPPSTATWLNLQIRRRALPPGGRQGQRRRSATAEPAAQRARRSTSSWPRTTPVPARRPPTADSGLAGRRPRVPGRRWGSTPTPRSATFCSGRCARPTSASTPATAAGTARRARCAAPTGCATTAAAARTVAMPGRVVVVGLGPAGADHLLPVARRVLERRDAAVRPHRPPSGGRGPRRRRGHVRDVRRALRRRARSRARVRGDRGRAGRRRRRARRGRVRGAGQPGRRRAHGRAAAGRGRRPRAGPGRLVRRSRLGAPRRRPDGG